VLLDRGQGENPYIMDNRVATSINTITDRNLFILYSKNVLKICGLILLTIYLTTFKTLIPCLFLGNENYFFTLFVNRYRIYAILDTNRKSYSM
jgi:hypothetical protein